MEDGVKSGHRENDDDREDLVIEDGPPGSAEGIEATQRISAAAPLTRVLVLTVVADEESVMEALLAGACGYLVKDARPEEKRS